MSAAWHDRRDTAIYSVYLSLVYLLAMPGGWFGDRVWGPARRSPSPAVVIMLGHLTLALPVVRHRSSRASAWSRSARVC